MKLKGIHEALASGCVVRGFLSDGGLRVVLIEKGNETKGYGKHPEIDEAIKHADEDYLAGGRKHKEVYGKGKIYPDYLAGSLSASSKLDEWLLKRRGFLANSSEGEVTVKLTGTKEFIVPRNIIEEVLESGLPQKVQTRKGYVYLLRKNEAGEIKISVFSRPEASNHTKDWFYEIQKIGKGKNFQEALHQALSAEEIEA